MIAATSCSSGITDRFRSAYLCFQCVEQSVQTLVARCVFLRQADRKKARARGDETRSGTRRDRNAYRTIRPAKENRTFSHPYTCMRIYTRSCADVVRRVRTRRVSVRGQIPTGTSVTAMRHVYARVIVDASKRSDGKTYPLTCMKNRRKPNKNNHTK